MAILPARREDRGRIPWTRNLRSQTSCFYYTDGSKQQNSTVGCAFTAVSDGQIIVEGHHDASRHPVATRHRLTDGADVFAAEVHVIKEAIADAKQRDLSDHGIYSDSRSVFETLNYQVSRHRPISEIKDLVKNSGVEVHMHWVKAQVGHVYNERADELAKAVTNRPVVDVEMETTRCQAKRHLFDRALSRWQDRWGTTGNGEVT